MENIWAASLTHPWILWIVLAVLTGFLEMVLPYFTFCFVSIAALVTAVASLQMGWPEQALCFAVALVLSLLVLRPRVMSRLQSPTQPMPSRSQSMQGLLGEVTEDIAPDRHGRVLVQGHDWAASGETAMFKGQKIVVVGSESIVLKVKEI